MPRPLRQFPLTREREIQLEVEILEALDRLDREQRVRACSGDPDADRE